MLGDSRVLSAFLPAFLSSSPPVAFQRVLEVHIGALVPLVPIAITISKKFIPTVAKTQCQVLGGL